MIKSLTNLRGVIEYEFDVDTIPERYISKEFILDFVNISSRILKRCPIELLNNEESKQEQVNRYEKDYEPYQFEEEELEEDDYYYEDDNEK